jgi:ADP-dependent phosphofructokinase/glucokinase
MADKIVLGLAGTVDYEITWDTAVIERLVSEYDIRPAELSTQGSVGSERDLLRSLLAFVRNGTGGERFIASSDIVGSFASHFGKKITLGGTCVRAALAMDKLGVKSTLHLVSIDDHVRRLLPPGCSYICSASHDTTDPHLIVQFKAGTRVRAGDIDIRSPHPNRLIFAHDPPHEELLISDELGSTLADAAVFLISGFNVIRNAAILDQRLATLKQHMASLSADCLVHYEDAGFHVPAMSHRVNRQLSDVINVHSMNEDEMQAYLGRTCNLLDAEEMAHALVELITLLTAPTVVVHTKYWSIAVGRGADSFTEALRGGVTMASTRYAYGDDFSEDDYNEVAQAPPSSAGAAFARAIEARMPGLVRCSPAVVMQTARPTMIGLGDSFVGGFLAAGRKP